MRERYHSRLLLACLSDPIRRQLEPTLNTLQAIVAVMDDSPPSLYLFEQGSEPWRSDSDFREVIGDYMPATNLKLRTFFREWFDDNDQTFRRSFWLAG